MEICSKALANNEKVFEAMYAIDGEIIELIEEIDYETNLIIVSTDRFKFQGLRNLKVGLKP